MEKTPNGNRIHIGIFGETNSGKSTLFNKILNTDLALVSEVKGTTTDPVKKAMELIPFGPIVLIDTAGIGDKSVLGEERVRKTMEVIEMVDFAIYVVNAEDYNNETIHSMETIFKSKNIPYILVLNKSDVALDGVKSCINILNFDDKKISELKEILIEELSALENKEIELMERLLPEGSVVVMVTPIDSAAPKGRLILPQVQLIRSCLDFGLRCHITDEKGLVNALEELKTVDLVVTDSQMFKIVDEIVPKEIPLTSFSILLARQKGDIKKLINGAKIIDTLKHGDKVLISEVCTHNITHEDIGRIKIPKLLNAYIKKNTGSNMAENELTIDFVTGKDYPENIDEYKLVIHCGGCMITSKQMDNRMNKIPNITNYGLLIAHCNGILDRSIEILE